MDVVFVVDFANEEDRDYYLDTDHAHQEFKKLAGKTAESVVVLDFVPF
jgi:hypothetical protein